MKKQIIMKRTAILWAFLLCLSTAQSQIVFADYSDPDVCEGTDGDYWLTASSFQCTPGLPILHSRDLLHWQHVNYAVERLLPVEHYDSIQHGCGVWAPSIRRHEDTYYIYWGDPDYGVFMVKATDPRGKWETPVLVLPAKGVIDTCPLWDEDGRVYLVNAWANSRCGFNSILTVRELSADGTRVIGQPVMVYDGAVEGNHTIEGPKIYKHDGYYYILAPAGGVEQGWQLALRSKNVYGPYESKMVFNQDGIHQGGWVTDKFLCFQERGAYGRILHLLDVRWKDGWPMMQRSKHDHLKASAHEGYQWHANYQEHFGFKTQNGIRLYSYNTRSAFKNLWEIPNLYLKKFEGETFSDTLHLTVSAKADGGQSGFVVMGRDYCRFSVELSGEQFLLKQITCKDADKGQAEQSQTIGSIPAKKYGAGLRYNYTCNVSFVIHCQPGGLCSFAYSLDRKKYHAIPATFQAREGKWIGAKYGVFSIAPHGTVKGWVDFIFSRRDVPDSKHAGLCWLP